MSPGFHPSISAEVYHADELVGAPTLSCSIAQILLSESPRKAWHSHPRLNPNYRAEAESKFDLGTCAHAVLLENDSSKIAVIDPEEYPSKKGAIPEGWTNNAIRAARDAARASGKTPLLKTVYADVRNMVDAALEFIKNSEIAEPWHAAQPEVTGLWCETNGKGKPIWLRCRFDKLAVPLRFIGDYKSTMDASPEAFSRLIARMGYHIQEAFYRRGARALGVDEPEFRFLAQCSEPPHECSLHACHPELQRIADVEVERAIGMWRLCLSENHWPSYGGRIHYALPTSHMLYEHEQRMAA